MGKCWESGLKDFLKRFRKDNLDNLDNFLLCSNGNHSLHTVLKVHRALPAWPALRCQALAKRNALKALLNADSFAYYVMDAGAPEWVLSIPPAVSKCISHIHRCKRRCNKPDKIPPSDSLNCSGSLVQSNANWAFSDFIHVGYFGFRDGRCFLRGQKNTWWCMWQYVAWQCHSAALSISVWQCPLLTLCNR